MRKFIRHFRLLLFIALLCIPFFSIAQEGNTNGNNTSPEIEAVKESFKKLFGSAFGSSDETSFAGLTVKSEASGEKNVSGSVSVFSKGNVKMQATLRPNHKPSLVKAEFPANAVINLANLNSLTGGRLQQYIPSGFPVESGIAVKEFSISLDTSGYKPEKFSVSFGNNQPWELMGDGSMAVNNASLVFEIENPASAERKISGNLKGGFQLGGTSIDLSALLSNNKEDIKFTGTISRLSIANLFNGVGKNSGLGAILNTIPDFISSLELNSLVFDIIPARKTFTGRANSSVGEVELMFKPGAGKNMQALLGIAPPSSFRFSQISSTLGLLDKLDLSGTGIVISSYSGPMESGLNNLKTPAGESRKLVEGLNVFTGLKFSSELANLLKVQHLSLYGSIDRSFNNVNFSAAFDFKDLELGKDVYLREVGFNVALGKTDVQFGLFGRLDATIKGDVLSFNAGFNFSPVDVELKAFFYMEALKKANAQLVKGTENEPPEWTEPFGIKGVGIRKLGAQVGISPKSPVLLSSLGFDAKFRLGTVTDRSKHFNGDFVANLSIADPSNTLIDIKVKNLTIIGLIDAFKENHGISGSLRSMLDWGLEEAYLRIVPNAQEFLGKRYERGIAAGGRLKLAGLAASCDLNIGDNGFIFRADIDPVEYKSGSFTWFALRGYDGSPKPMINLNLTSSPEIDIRGSATVLGITSNTSIKINSTGLTFDINGNILNGALGASLKVKAQSLTESGGFHVSGSFTNDLQTRVAQGLVSFIRQASQESQQRYNAAKKALADARNKQSDPAAQFFTDVAKSTVAAFQEIDKGMAVAGEYVVKGLIEQSINIRSMTFATDINKNNLNVNLTVDMIIAGRSIRQTISFDLNIKSVSEAVEKIVGQIKDVAVSAFENLGSEIEKGWNDFTKGAEQFFQEVQKSFDVLGKEFEKAGVAAVNWVEGAAMTVYNWGDETFNGAKVTPPAQGNAPSMVPYTVTRYKVTTNWIRCDRIPKTIDALGTNWHTERSELEIFGNIQIIPGGRGMWTNASSNQYSFNKRIGDAVTINERQFHNVSNVKYFYSNDRDRAGNTVTVYCHLLESDYPLYSDEMRNSATINFGQLLPGQSVSREIYVTDGEQGVTVSVTVEAVAKISDYEMMAAAGSRNAANTETVIRRGGNPTIYGLIEAAVKNDDDATLKTLLRYGAIPTAQDFQVAMSVGARNTLVTLINNGVPVGPNELMRSIELRDRYLADIIIKNAVPPTSDHILRALQLNDREMVKFLLSKGVIVAERELQVSVNNNDQELIPLLMNSGAIPTSAMLVHTVKINQPGTAVQLLRKMLPTQEAFQEAANANNALFFRVLAESNGKLENNAPINTAIDKGNEEILRLGLQHNGNATDAMNFALSRNNLHFARVCLDFKATPSSALVYAVRNNNAEFTNLLLQNYSADAGLAMQEAINANNIAIAGMVLGGSKINPNSFIATAAESGKTEIVKLLVERNADPNRAMPSAILLNNNTLAAYLISKGANARVIEYIEQAAKNNNLEMVKLLVQNGANANNGMPHAIANYSTEIIRYLLDKGASPKGYIGKAAKDGKGEIVKLLLDKGALPDEGLQAAIVAQNVAITKLLLDKNANPQGYIQIPASDNNPDMVNLLLQYGAKPDPGMPPAVDRGFNSIVKMLLDKGASPAGYLNKPASTGNIEMVRMLLEKNADPNEGIESSIRGNHTVVIKMLIEKGADGNRFIDLPSGFGNLEIVKLLLSKGAKAENGIKPAVTNGHAPVAEALIAAGADGSKKEYMDLTVAKKFAALVPVLVKGGAKVDSSITDSKQRTYLHQAAEMDNSLALIKELLAAGSSVRVKDIDGNTPLHLAVDEGRDDIETVRALLQAGADPCAENKKGRNIFKQARGTKVKKLIKDFGGSRKCSE